MKSLLVLSAIILGPVAAFAQALDSSPSAADAITPPPPPAAASGTGEAHDAAGAVPLPGQSTGPALENTMPLIPETAPSSTSSGKSHRSHTTSSSSKAAPGASPKQASTFLTEQDLHVRIRIRQAETKALNDPSIQADWAAAHQARKDPERRELLTAYYTHLYGKMLKMEPSLAERINARKESALARMKYSRLGDPDASEDPFASPTPPGPGSDSSTDGSQ